MKRNLLYIALAALGGLLAGYLFFGSSSGTPENATRPHDHEASSEAMWTCSMHPQIMQPEPGDCPICGMDLIPAGVGGGELPSGQFRMSQRALALADIRTTVVGASDGGSQTLKLTGTIEADEKGTGTQASYFDGRIEKLMVNFEGEAVRTGQQLATLYSPELVSAQQELLTASRLKESQPQLYQAVRNKLKLWKLTESQIEQIENSGRVQEYFPIYATVSGTVSEIFVKAGDYVQRGAPLFRIENLGTVWAVFDAYEEHVSLLKEGQDIEISTRAYPGKVFRAKVSFVSPVLEAATRTVEVRAVLQNPGERLKPGMFVSGFLGLGAATGGKALVIPESAVLWTGERSVVYVKPDSENPVFEMREIEVGDLSEEGYRVLSGLQNGEEIVTNGTFTIDAAAQLQGKKSMMNEGGGPGMDGHGAHSGPATGGPSLGLSEDLGALQASLKKEFTALLPDYLTMKDAFVLGDSQSVQEQADRMVAGLLTMAKNHPGQPAQARMGTIRELLEAISGSGSIEEQRALFVKVNESLIPVFQAIGSSGQPLYVQTCPMANNNKGAIWLSSEKEIRNPYYGDAMLACGSVIDFLE